MDMNSEYNIQRLQIQFTNLQGVYEKVIGLQKNVMDFSDNETLLNVLKSEFNNFMRNSIKDSHLIVLYTQVFLLKFEYY